jgi:hypothetical protein
MAATLFPGFDPVTWTRIAQDVRAGEFRGRRVLFWREDVEPSDRTVRLRVRCEGDEGDIVYAVDAQQLANYEKDGTLDWDAPQAVYHDEVKRPMRAIWAERMADPIWRRQRW